MEFKTWEEEENQRPRNAALPARTALERPFNDALCQNMIGGR